MSEATRPEWASGPEWEGWMRGSDDLVERSFRDDAREPVWLTISADGVLEIGSSSCFISLASPAHALNAANALAEAAGGWE